MSIVLKSAYEVSLETRSSKSYGVIMHRDYKNLQKPNGELVTEEEVELLLNIGYSLDCGFTKKEKVFIGESDDYKYMRMFNDDCTTEGMISLVEMSGLYHSIGSDANGNIQMRRVGSNSNYSGYIYSNSNLFKIMGSNLFDSAKDIFSPFDIYCLINSFSMGQAIKKIKEKYAQRK